MSNNFFDLSRRFSILIFAILATHLTLLILSALRHSPSVDEVGHLAAGLSHWKFRRFELYSVNPPLPRMLATGPLMLLDLNTVWSSVNVSPGSRSEFEVGKDIVNANMYKSLYFFWISRSVLAVFNTGGALLVWFWSFKLYGRAGSLISLLLWCFCPNVLAHSQLITPDAFATTSGLFSSFFFCRWLRRPGADTAAISGFFLGIALLSKFTWIILFGLWPILWIIVRIPEYLIISRKDLIKQTIQLLFIVNISVFIINCGYLFDNTFVPIRNFAFVSNLFGCPGGSCTGFPFGNRFCDSWIGSCPIPLPSQFVLGIDSQRRDFEVCPPSYLRGEWRRGGWWYYYLYGLTIKLPLGTLVILIWYFIAKFKTFSISLDEKVLFATCLTVFVFVSSQTGINQHLRYILPCLPCAYILAGWLGKILFNKKSKIVLKLALITMLLFSTFSSLYRFPHSMSYFNELVGGPLGGPNHLLDSNVDWGQDLLFLKEWFEANPDCRPLSVAYRHGYIEPTLVGIHSYTNLLDFHSDALSPSFDSKFRPIPGWYAISVHLLYRYDSPFGYFRSISPVTSAGYSILIFHVE